MAIRRIIITICALVFLQCTTAKMQVTNIYYTDQNNNRFSITSEKLQYHPIKVIESSSGTYDGGTPKTIALSEEVFSKLRELAAIIEKDNSLHTKDRRMMTSILRTTFTNKSKEHHSSSYILIRSKARTQLENKLKELIN